MGDWISLEHSKPSHGSKTISKSGDGREFKTEYFHWSEELKPYFKLRGSVWDHGNVVYWRYDND